MNKKKFKKKKSVKKVKESSLLKGGLLSLLAEYPDRAWSAQQLARKLGAKKRTQQQELTNLLDELEADGSLERLSNQHYKSTRQAPEVTGRVDHVNPRFAFVVTDDPDEEDVYVTTVDLSTAIHGDIVRVRIFRTTSERKEGLVIEIVKRARNRFAGRIEVSKQYAFVIPDFKRIYQDFFISPKHYNGAKNNDKVIFEVIRWTTKDKCPEAHVVEILGKTGENDAEIHSIMAEFDLPFRFTKTLLKEADKIDGTITKKICDERRDFRKICTFTIDPEDAKDFDDALSFKVLDNGHYEVGIHIADVTHYVQPNSILDQEAFDRSTSVYLVDRTIPMLPERLSNDLCSLRPHEDKLTFSAVFELNAEVQVIKEWFGRTVIHSDHRFTYEAAQKVIDDKKGAYENELTTLNKLAKQLRAERFKNGAINFDTTEVSFKLDEKGHPLGVIPKVRVDAHKLIEEFMLLANRSVATFIHKMKKGNERQTFVYRTHDYPNQERVADFSLFAKQFGHAIDPESPSLSKALNKLMTTIEGTPEQNVLQTLAIRSMSKAIYTTKAAIHFGLGFKHYTHFTSPIRRYPDMMVHRLLQHYLDQGKAVNQRDYEAKCVHASEREKRAADAERASIKYKQVEFMSYAVDKPFKGIITGVTDFGIFVEITETKCEGMVRLMDLKDDFYEFDERNYRVIGRRRKKIYRLGDNVTVRILKTDVDRRLMDLTFSKD